MGLESDSLEEYDIENVYLSIIEEIVFFFLHSHHLFILFYFIFLLVGG